MIKDLVAVVAVLVVAVPEGGSVKLGLAAVHGAKKVQVWVLPGLVVR
jgi:hypothetical protein